MTLHPGHQRHLQMELAGSQAGRSRVEVTTLVAAMQADLAHPWSLAELAEIAHLSPSRRRQLFVEILGMPPMAWLTLQRVRAMARTISATDTTIRQAAAEVGWMNQAHAAKQFRKLTWRSPTEYRAKVWSQNEPVGICRWCGHPIKQPSSRARG